MVATTFPPVRPRLAAPVVVALAGAAVLLARPWLADGLDDPAPLLVALFTTIGVVGAWWPVARSDRPAGARTSILVALVGAGAFGIGRLLAGGHPAAPALLGYVLLNSLAAVAEEALFRRLVYDTLSGFGPAVAVVGSASLFAIVHVTVWGLWVLPLDLAAGLLLSWQRWASGRWSVPAATHILANLVAVLR